MGHHSFFLLFLFKSLLDNQKSQSRMFLELAFSKILNKVCLEVHDIYSQNLLSFRNCFLEEGVLAFTCVILRSFVQKRYRYVRLARLVKMSYAG